MLMFKCIYLLRYFDHFYWRLEIDRGVFRTQSNIYDKGFTWLHKVLTELLGVEFNKEWF